MDLIAVQMIPCKCGSLPFLYEEGAGKRQYTDGKWEMFFTDSYGYYVECPECGETTRFYSDATAAILNWNRGIKVGH